MKQKNSALTTEARATCWRCLKAATSCLCERIRPFSTETLFAILMHPKERRDRAGTGTGRLTHLALRHSSLLIGLDFDIDPRLSALTSRPDLVPFVLYPGDETIVATNLSEVSGAKAFQMAVGLRRPLIIVIDGSWSCARKIMKRNPKLASLPRVGFVHGAPSRFTFKAQPAPHCLSTLEAVHTVIELLCRHRLDFIHPHGAHANLLEVFEALVAFQLAHDPRPKNPS